MNDDSSLGVSSDSQNLNNVIVEPDCAAE
ncbi:unnamed protein product, partial [Rotaria magnacalcarata]